MRKGVDTGLNSARKRDALSPVGLLRDVITSLEASTARKWRHAIMRLLAEGPLLTSDAFRHVTDHRDDPAYAEIGAELLAFTREVVRLGGNVDAAAGIATESGARFRVQPVKGSAHLLADGATVRDAAILQYVWLIYSVGLDNVRACGAPDCPHVFVKSYRREYCSLNCQRRTNKRQQRDAAKRAKEQEQRRRRHVVRRRRRER